MIWDAYLHYMNKIFIREYGHSFHLSFFEMNDLQKKESSYKEKLSFQQDNEFMIFIKQEFQLFRYDESINAEIRLFDIENEILNKFNPTD